MCSKPIPKNNKIFSAKVINYLQKTHIRLAILTKYLFNCSHSDVLN